MSIPWRIYDILRDFYQETVIYKGLKAPIEDLSGQVLLVTGGNAGLGKESVRQLALMKPAKIILAARNMEKGERAKTEIVNATGFKNVVVEHLDLCSLESVNKLSRKILDNEKSLHVLMCNAGLGSLPESARKTGDGFDEMFQGNNLGHHLLVTNLLPLLERSGSSQNPSRVILLSSLASKFVFSFDVNAYSNPQKLSSNAYYGISKLMATLLASGLAEREQDKNVVVHSCHPGTVKTEFGDKYPMVMRKYIFPVLYSMIGRPLDEGAATQVFLASSPNVRESGQYWTNMENRPPNTIAQNPQLCRQFTELCDELISKYKL
ncbi:Oxidoreductase, short-chain dehydrogenase/reductase family [Taphrina deformans PYCC 5710]|uniref:Oxidoreductase, short-chain dehydrogenase/reductase family n=1 Tax=Taphrina deformans (strain PYCC 5710 / ATCC 11124 / CBS 356.35 / IMI 108563 / JCM 9778 / NBRC 8474) TaxID=1097556 RepID=R4XAY6_TAPDE|nr:Oxidoreductase, short-chain dehydrogenase/reductase family [Taphrina deformans PYCC 5710]|eukprot:CCG81488.1 Oxidoreductase, short-chain dehydrogenase/reductase family [Taphrina deformans PYCC 5710]